MRNVRIDPVLAQTFAVVLDEGTLEAAARALHVTPSAVSQRLRHLEQQVGQHLLVRSKPVRATEAGEVVLRFARRYVLLEAEALEDLGLEDDGARPRLTLAVNSDSLATWFLPALAAFDRHHDTQIELLREDQDATAQLLASGAAMAAVTSSPVPSPGCSVTPLGRLVYVAVASPRWWERWIGDPSAAESLTAESSQVSADALAAAPRIDFDRSDDLQAAWLRDRGVDPSLGPRHLVPSTHDLAAAVEAGLGWGMLLTHQAEPLLREGGVLPLGGAAVTTPLYWQVSRSPSALLRALTDIVVDVARAQLRQG